jgi:hypothetical protein
VLIREAYQEAFRALIGWYKGEENDFPTETGAETEREGMDAMEIDGPSVTFSNPFKSLSRDITSKRRGFIALGHPGIGKRCHLLTNIKWPHSHLGKTVWLCLLLVLRIHARLPTIYQFRENYFYYFHAEGVSIISVDKSLIATDIRNQFDPSTWCLVDSNLRLGAMPGFIQDLDFFIVQAASSRQHHLIWTDKVSRPVRRYYMKVWDIPELIAGYVNYAHCFDDKCFKSLQSTISRRYLFRSRHQGLLQSLWYFCSYGLSKMPPVLKIC